MKVISEENDAKCDECGRSLAEYEKKFVCPSCGYIYCPECVQKTERQNEEIECIFCEGVVEFIEEFVEDA